MNKVILRSLLFLLSFISVYPTERRLPRIFAYDPNFAASEAEMGVGVYRLETITVIGKTYHFPIAFEREMKRILKLQTRSNRPILERVNFIPEDRSDMPAYLQADRVAGPFRNEKDALRFHDGFVINLPGGQKMNTYFKSFVSFKVGRGTLELRPSRNQLIRYRLKW